MTGTGNVVVVGGGIGGLAAAIRCAAAGRQTTLIEARPSLGGKLSVHQDAGYTWDAGPSLLTMPWVLDELLTVAGSSLAAEFDIVALPSACRYLWEDGTVFDAHASLPALLTSMQQISAEDAAAFVDFLSYAGTIWNLTADPFLYQPFEGLRSFFKPALLARMGQLDALRTMDQAVRSYFRHPYIQQIMNRFATYNGSSPFRTAATFNTIAWAEFALGAFYPRGGMWRIAQVLEATARRLGVDIQLGDRVSEISHHNGAVTGVCTAGGRFFAAQHVVCNVDPQIAYGSLIPGAAPRAAALQRRELSMSGMAILWGMDCVYPQLDHHTVCFSPDYRHEFAQIDAGMLPSEPTIYLNHTITYDPGHAPTGGQNIFALVNVPPQRGQHRWADLAEGYAAQVAKRLSRYGLQDFAQHITVQHILTPDDFAARYNAPGGAIYGLASNARTSAFMRPAQRDAQVRGLVFCGTGTHPGGGVPLAMLSGKHAAGYVLTPGTH